MEHQSNHDVFADRPSDPEKQIDLESPSQLIQPSSGTSPQNPEQPDALPANAVEKVQTTATTRKDKHRLHSMRHAALSRYPLEALARLGENIRQLRKFERSLRTELKPPGAVGALVFDRLWSSYLRCLLGARAEAVALTPMDRPGGAPCSAAGIRADEMPTLILNDLSSVSEVLSPGLFRQLALVARYDRHFSREMYRALTMLLVAKGGGQTGVERCLGQALEFSINNPEESADE